MKWKKSSEEDPKEHAEYNIRTHCKKDVYFYSIPLTETSFFPDPKGWIKWNEKKENYTSICPYCDVFEWLDEEDETKSSPITIKPGGFIKMSGNSHIIIENKD